MTGIGFDAGIFAILQSRLKMSVIQGREAVGGMAPRHILMTAAANPAIVKYALTKSIPKGLLMKYWQMFTCLTALAMLTIYGCRAKQSDSETQSFFSRPAEVDNLDNMPASLVCYVISPENDPNFPEGVRDPDFWMFEKAADGYTAKQLDGSRNAWGRVHEFKQTTKGLVKITFRDNILVLENSEHRFDLATSKPESNWKQKRPAKTKGLRNCRPDDVN